MKRKLGRKKSHREQTIRNLAISIILYEKVKTTLAKAKEARSLVQQSINISKTKNLKSQRQLLGIYNNNKNVVNKLFDDLSLRFKDITSGYMKVFKQKPRLGDNAPTAILILSKSKFLNNLPTKKIKTKISSNKQS